MMILQIIVDKWILQIIVDKWILQITVELDLELTITNYTALTGKMRQ
jgi:hypothetical protein